MLSCTCSRQFRWQPNGILNAFIGGWQIDRNSECCGCVYFRLRLVQCCAPTEYLRFFWFLFCQERTNSFYILVRVQRTLCNVHGSYINFASACYRIFSTFHCEIIYWPNVQPKTSPFLPLFSCSSVSTSLECSNFCTANLSTSTKQSIHYRSAKQEQYNVYQIVIVFR